jgi:hypothetical protein
MAILRTTPGVRRVAAAGALALAGFALTAPTASAGESEAIETEGGSVVFHHRGDRLEAYDERRDGYGVRARVIWNDESGGHEKYVTDYSSSGGPARRNLSFREGQVLWLEMCYTKNRRSVKCSLSQRAEA